MFEPTPSQDQEAGASGAAAPESGCAHARLVRISWARLLKRVFQIDLGHCPNCGGQRKIIAAILEAPVIERLLTHLGLQARAPPRALAREVLSKQPDEGGPAPRAAGRGCAWRGQSPARGY